MFEVCKIILGERLSFLYYRRLIGIKRFPARLYWVYMALFFLTAPLLKTAFDMIQLKIPGRVLKLSRTRMREEIMNEVQRTEKKRLLDDAIKRERTAALIVNTHSRKGRWYFFATTDELAGGGIKIA